MDHLILENILPLELLAAIRGRKLVKYTRVSFPELIKSTFLSRDEDVGLLKRIIRLRLYHCASDSNT